MGAKKELSGRTFGRLIVISDSGKRAKDGTIYWSCRCECGNILDVYSKSLTNGKTRSCGCLNMDSLRANGKEAIKHIRQWMKKNKHPSVTHGKTNSKEYVSWIKLKSRCENPNDIRYDLYGKRGIKVCERWKKFEEFYADMGSCPDGFSIDRIDNEKDYYPENCRWATKSQQQRNKRNNRKIEAFGEVKLLCEWSNKFGISPSTIFHRLKNNWSTEDAVSKPVRSKVF